MRNKNILAFGITLLVVSILIGAGGNMSSSIDSTVRQSIPAAREAHDQIIIDGNADLIIQKAANNWTGTGEVDAPITIADYRIEFYDEGITIRNVDLHFAIINCATEEFDTQYWGSVGIKLVNCSNGLISESDAAMKETGVLIHDSSNIVLNSTTVHDCFTGVTISESRYIVIKDNNLGWNDWVGINMTATHWCTLVRNSIVAVPDYGIKCIADSGTYLSGNIITSIYLDDDEFHHIGIYSFDSFNFAMHLTNISECGTALYMKMTDGSWIWECSFTDTTEYGIYLDVGTYNVTIIENYLGPTEGENAYDDGVENTWDSSYYEIGNTWSDYSGTGYYYIPGSAGSIDHYPNGYTPSTTTNTTTTTTTTTTANDSDSSSSTTSSNGTIFELPGEVTLAISIGSAVVILVVVVVIIRGKE